MRPLFIDSSVLLYAVGSDHPVRDAGRALLAAAAEGRFRLHLSVEAGQEFLFHRIRRSSKHRALLEFEQLDAIAIWHPFDADILRAARNLIATSGVRGRDAVHAATAIAAGFTEIVSSDLDFDGIPGIRRLDPLSDLHW